MIVRGIEMPGHRSAFNTVQQQSNVRLHKIIKYIKDMPSPNTVSESLQNLANLFQSISQRRKSGSLFLGQATVSNLN